MTDTKILDQTFHFIMETFIERGNAPFYTEIAEHLNVKPDKGREILQSLISTGVTPMWLHPGTDLIASVAPFNNLPNQYRITIEGHQKWFGQ